jgi:hypothetical protein
LTAAQHSHDLLRSLASRLWLWTRGPTLDADQCINVVRYRCCRLQPAVELLLALSLLPFVDRRGLSHPFHSLNLAAAITFTPMGCRWDIASSRPTSRHDALLDRACVCAILRSICDFWKSDLPSRYTCGLGHFAMACKCSDGLEKRVLLYEWAPTKSSILASSRFCLTNVVISNAPRQFQSDQFSTITNGVQADILFKCTGSIVVLRWRWRRRKCNILTHPPVPHSAG